MLTKAARLECDNHGTSQFNLPKALNQFLLHYLNKTDSNRRSLVNALFYMINRNRIDFKRQSLINPVTEMLKTFIISNTRLLNNRDRIDIEENSSVWLFLLYSIYQLRYWYYYAPPDIFINMKFYLAGVDFLFFFYTLSKTNK